MFRGSAKSTGYPLHSPVSPSLPLPCVTVCHHISTGLYALSPYIKQTCFVFKSLTTLWVVQNIWCPLNWKGCGRRWSWRNVRHVPGIYLEGQRKKTKCIGHDDQPFGWDLNRAPPRSLWNFTARTPSLSLGQVERQKNNAAFCTLTLIVLMWRIGWAHNNARK